MYYQVTQVQKRDIKLASEPEQEGFSVLELSLEFSLKCLQSTSRFQVPMCFADAL